MANRYVRLLAGNKQLARSVNSYIKTRDKMTRLEWTRRIKPAMKNMQNTIEQQLLSTSVTEWDIFNLKRILGSIQGTINNFENQFATALISGQGNIAQIAKNATLSQTSLVGLTSPAQSLLGTELIQTLTPLTENLIHYFANDVAKVIGGSIQNSIISRKSPGEAIRNLRKLFGIDSELITKLNTEKVLLKNAFKKNKINKTIYKGKLKIINGKLNSGSIASYARAERIVRTEMLTASSMAQQQTGLEIADINPDAGKVWLWSHKPTGRVSHQTTEQFTKQFPLPIDQPFIVGTEEAMFPRDPALSASERVQCGCSMVIVNTRDGTADL